MFRSIPARSLLLAGALALLAACQPKTTPMKPEEAQRVEKITERTSARCVGRYLIDLPASFVLNSQWVAEIEGVAVDMRPMDKRKFDGVLAARKSELERERIDGEQTPSLKETRKLPDEAGLAFNRSKDRGSAALRTWELLAWRDGYQLSASIDARDMSESRRLNEDDTRRTTVEEKFEQLMAVYSRLRGRAENEIPKEPGFCIANGFVAGTPSEEEETYIAFHLEGARDVYFSVSAEPEGVKEQTRLLERSAQVEKEMEPSGTQTIRKGVVEHGGMSFDEWLMKGPTPDHGPGTMFIKVANETKPGTLHPYVRLELFNGFEIPAPQRTAEESAQWKRLERATLSEAEAVAIWDKVTPTLRLRPGAL